MRLPIFLGVIATLALATIPRLAAAQPANDRICFPEAAPTIQDCIDGRFAEFWRENGGLAVFGYPISAAQPEINSATGQTYLTQYFERQRFEQHPENARPYDVLLGRLGDDELRRTGRDWHMLPQADASRPHYRPETGHAIAPEFYAYYRSHGLELGDRGISDRESLALFGYPISEPMMEAYGEQQLLIQYFERARIELHPNNPQAHRILQGRLGSGMHAGADDHRTPSSGPGHDDNDHRTPSPEPGHGDDDHRSPTPGPGHDDDDHRDGSRGHD
jgi:hypothetical protein